MAKLTLSDVANISGQETSAINTINTNNAAIETALENTFSRDGTSPNTLNTDIDLNGNDILNAGTIEADYLVIQGETLTSELYAIGPQGPQGIQGVAGTTSPPASTSAAGILEIATTAELVAGSPTDLAVVNHVLKSYLDIVEPIGRVAWFLRSSVPGGWVPLSGGSIGNASSGATVRANADTETLYTHLWNSLANTEAAVQTSAGVAATRGASAAADFAANKRIVLPDVNNAGLFIRGKEVARAIGSTQDDAFESHTHTGNADAAGIHDHSLIAHGTSRRGANGINSGTSLYGSSGDTEQGGIAQKNVELSGNHVHTLTIGATGSTETRPKNISMLACMRYQYF